MADELQLVSLNAVGDSWVDGVPGAVSTGYQAQNTALQALFNGLDNSSVRISGGNVIIDPSGIIDDSGLPFVVSSAITLALPTTGAAAWYLKVVAGSTPVERSIEWTDARGTYEPAKNGFYSSGGERVLNWVYDWYSGDLVRITASNIERGRAPVLYGRGAEYALPEETALAELAYYDSFSPSWAYAYYPPTDGFLFSWVESGQNKVTRTNRQSAPQEDILFANKIDSLVWDHINGNLITHAVGNLRSHPGLSSGVGSINFALAANDISIDAAGNLISCTADTVKIHAGISATVTTTINISNSRGLGVNTVYGVTYDWLRDLMFLSTGDPSRLRVYQGLANVPLGAMNSVGIALSLLIGGLGHDPLYGGVLMAGKVSMDGYYGGLNRGR